MSIFRLSTMLMKTSELNPSLHDVNEKKYSYRKWTGHEWPVKSSGLNTKAKRRAEPRDNLLRVTHYPASVIGSSG